MGCAKHSARHTAIKRRRKFLALVFLGFAAVVAAVICAVVLINKAVKNNSDKILVSADTGNKQSVSSDVSKDTASGKADKTDKNDKTEPDIVKRGDYELDANYSRLLLVNSDNPLPSDFDYEGNLGQIEDKYNKNATLDKLDKDIIPYVNAMIEAAWKDGVNLLVWSPYRSYAIQNTLFENQVNRCIAKGLSGEAARNEAATVVARPGTSEHHTGLAADFNMASDEFETTPMYTWMQQHAQEYGFVMRYPADKVDVTGVIYESWHYRFVGINTATEMKKLSLTLEEYLDYKKITPKKALDDEIKKRSQP